MKSSVVPLAPLLALPPDFDIEVKRFSWPELRRGLVPSHRKRHIALKLKIGRAEWDKFLCFTYVTLYSSQQSVFLFPLDAHLTIVDIK
jgi:hypothetical protein